MDTQLTEASVTLIAGMLTRYAMNFILAFFPALSGKKIIALTVPLALAITVPLLVYVGVHASAAVVFALTAGLTATGFNEAVKVSVPDVPLPPAGGAA
jgi:hypothetical protein